MNGESRNQVLAEFQKLAEKVMRDHPHELGGGSLDFRLADRATAVADLRDNFTVLALQFGQKEAREMVMEAIGTGRGRPKQLALLDEMLLALFDMFTGWKGLPVATTAGIVAAHVVANGISPIFGSSEAAIAKHVTRLVRQREKSQTKLPI